MTFAFNYIKANGGIDTGLSYRYEGIDGKCRFIKANVGASVTVNLRFITHFHTW